MLVDKYLKELALSNRRVIIPDLGAFLSKEGDGDEKNLIFSSFLKYNDGFLEKQLAEKEKIAQTQAAEEIKKFVEEVAKTVRAKQNYAIDSFGFFYTDDRGSIAFSPQGTEATGKPAEEKPLAAHPIAVDTIPSTPKEATANTPEAAPIAAATPLVAEQPKVEQATAKPVIPQQTAPIIPPPITPSPSRPESPKQTTILANQQPQKKSNGNKLLITILVLLLAIIGLLLLYFMVPSIKEKVSSIFGIQSTTTEQVASPPVAEQPVDTIPKADSVEAIVETPVQKNTTPKAVQAYGSNYYVIAGTFQEKSNADKMYKRCITDGYDAELLPKMGPLYPVSIFNSPSKAECTKVMKEAQRKYGDAWIFKSRRY